MALFEIFKKVTNTEEKALSTSPQYSNDLIENSENILAEVNVDLTKADAVELPIAQLAALGGGIASLLPAFRKITSAVSLKDDGLYRLHFPKDVIGHLATARDDGLNLGSILNNKGRIVGQARLEKVGPQTVNSTSMLPIKDDPFINFLYDKLSIWDKLESDTSYHHLENFRDYLRKYICYIE